VTIATPRTQAADLALWFGLLAAPLAWATQLVLSYGVEEMDCPLSGSGSVAGLDVKTFVGIVTVVAALVAIGGLVIATAGALGSGVANDPLGRAGFMAWGGVLVSIVFLGAILLGGSSIVSLEPCEAG
jgi:hypothetical protein